MGISPLNRTKRDGHASLAMTATGTAFSFSNHRFRGSGARKKRIAGRGLELPDLCHSGSGKWTTNLRQWRLIAPEVCHTNREIVLQARENPPVFWGIVLLILGKSPNCHTISRDSFSSLFIDDFFPVFGIFFC